MPASAVVVAASGESEGPLALIIDLEACPDGLAQNKARLRQLKVRLDLQPGQGGGDFYQRRPGGGGANPQGLAPKLDLPILEGETDAIGAAGEQPIALQRRHVSIRVLPDAVPAPLEVNGYEGQTLTRQELRGRRGDVVQPVAAGIIPRRFLACGDLQMRL